MNGPQDKRDGDENLRERAGQLLNEQADSLDGTTRSRLNRARNAALDELDRRDAGFLRGWNWAPAGGFVLASVLVAVVWVGGLQNIGAPGGDVPPLTLPGLQAPAADLDMLIVDEDFELLKDLDFYNWMQSVPGTAGMESVG
jgi:hypothetical protein